MIEYDKMHFGETKNQPEFLIIIIELVIF